MLEDSGKTSFSKWKRRFHFEEEKQRRDTEFSRKRSERSLL
jgi:hypothetical protein